jgi:hypothetical protein
MRSKWQALGLTVVTVTALLVGFGQQNESSPAKDQTSRTELEKRLAQLPIVDFVEIGESDPIRRAKSDRHNSPVAKEGIKKPQLNDNMKALRLDLPLSHQPAGAALPASDVVIIGNVHNVQAFLSTDRTAVYSEVTFTVEQVLKGRERVTPGINVTAERSGGAVRFPSGKILRRGSLGRNIPVQGNRYLLFLNSNQVNDSFTIDTGYELANNSVIPLDGTGDNDEVFKPYEKYRNATVTTLLEDVRKAIANEARPRNGSSR